MTTAGAALTLLLRLRLGAGWRRFVRTIRRPKGLVAFIASVAFMSLWLLPAFFSKMPSRWPGSAPDAVGSTDGAGAAAPSLVPLAIVGILLATILGKSGDRALAFTQSEVDMLFPAPFTRRQLLVYKLARQLVPMVVSALFLSLFMRVLGPRWLSIFVGIFLVLMFLNHAALCAAMAAQLLGEHRFRVWRRIALVGVLVAVASLGWWLSRQDATSLLESARRFAGSPVGRIVALPTTPFARALGAADLVRELPLWAGVSLAINLALGVLALRLDANWLEASAESSRLLQERLERFRTSGGLSTRAPGLAFVRLPMGPRLGGAGPIVWRQLTAAVRGGSRGLWIIVVVLAAIVVPQLIGTFLSDDDASEAANKGRGIAAAFRSVGWFLLVYVGLFVPQLLRADFRGDIDRMDLLKALPMSPTVVAAGQIAAPTIVATLLQWTIGGVFVAFVPWPFGALPLWALVLLGANLVNVALDNIFFLVWPLRTHASPGLNMVGGQMLVGVVKMLALLVALGIVGGVAALVGWATAGDRWAIAASAACVVAVEAVALVLAAGALFRAFDPAIDRAPDA